MRFRICLFVCITLLLPGVLRAQKIFYPGYVVTNEGDTLRGKIPFDIATNNNYHLVRLKDEKGFEKRFNVWQIKMYYFNQEYYYTRKAEMGETEHRKNLVFMHLIDTGKVRLFEYEFVKKFGGSNEYEAGGFSTSGERQFYVELVSGELVYLSKKNYLQQLGNLFNTRPDVLAKIQEKDFNYKEIPAAVRLFNHPTEKP